MQQKLKAKKVPFPILGTRCRSRRLCFMFRDEL